MSTPDQEELIKLIEEDIQKLKDNIFTDLTRFSLEHIQQSDFDVLDFNLLIDFKYFEEKVKSVCYQLRSQVHTSIGPDLSERLQLFSKNFFSKLGDVRDVTIHRCWSKISYGDFEQAMFIKLLFAILRRHLITDKDVSEIFLMYLEMWETFLETEKMPVNILIQMPNIEFKGDYELIKDRIYLKGTIGFTTLSSSISHSRHKSLLVYKTQLSCKIYTSTVEHNSNFQRYQEIFDLEWTELLKEIQDVVFTFYFNLVDFEYETFIEEYPWWFEFDNKEFLKLEESHKRRIFISEDIVKSVVELYPVVVNSNVSGNNDLIIASHHYRTLHNRDFLPDVFVDSSILLEFLFSRDSREDLAFQISCNAGLFLTDTEDEFLLTFKFVKAIYSIRSALFHGDKWERRLQRFLDTNSAYDNSIQVLEELKRFTTLCLKKLLLLMETDPQILTDINQLAKEENKIKKGTYLTKLAIMYEDDNNYSESLRIYARILKIYEEIKDDKKVDELLGKIKTVYNKGKKVLIHSKELQKFVEELGLIIRAESDRKDIAEELLEVINRFGMKRAKNKNPKIELAIGGKEIMETLTIEPSKRVGEIIKILQQKVNSKELENIKEDLIDFVKSLD